MEKTVDPYLELLKEELVLKCSERDSSINAFRILKKKHFEKMAAIIQGIAKHKTSGKLEESDKKEAAVHANAAISVSTLERLFKYGYPSDSKDERVSNTLNKLVRFLEYEDWEAFIEKKNIQFHITNKKTLDSALIDVVNMANQAEFEAYYALPQIQTENLKRHLVSTGTAYKRIYNILVLHSERQWRISNAHNPSGHITKEIKITSVSGKRAIIKTNEYWYLRWFETPTSRYRHIYNEDNVQTWMLEFDGITWKVLSTYYPSPINSIQITHIIISNLNKFFSLKT